MHVGTIAVHREYLVALVGFARGLKDDLLAVEGKIGLGIVAIRRELADVAKMNFLRMRCDALRFCDVQTRRHAGCDHRDCNDARELH